jgi:hypothetical protein
MTTRTNAWMWAMLLVIPACQDKDLDADDSAAMGEACDPAGGEDAPECENGLVCEQVDAADGYVCGAPLEIRGLVIDAMTEAPIADALVAALDETGTPVGDSTRSDANGHYVLQVHARRDPEGELASAIKWTMFSAAVDYAPFPGGIRPAIPVDATGAIEETVEEDDDEYTIEVIENITTTIALLHLPESGGFTVAGTVGGEEPGGTLVVAEGGEGVGRYSIADASGRYVIFNVPTGAASIRGYRVGLELEPTSATVADADLAEIDLTVVAEGIDELATLAGSVNVVNPGDGNLTSVVLVPVSVFDTVLERGPVPMGLRAPSPPEAPTVASAFQIAGVPSGTYKALAAFENDALVRDPDTSIGGTTLQEVTVARGSGTTTQDESFKVTGALGVISPGADAPEWTDAAPDLVWQDDSSEDGYHLWVYDAFGNLVWEVPEVPRVTGSAEVRVTWDGPALETGMAYQFRVASYHDEDGMQVFISKSEDLRGVFFFGTAPTTEDE